MRRNDLDAHDLCRTYGTSEPPKLLRRIEKGPLSFLYSDAAIRQIEWHGVEIVRAIAWPIRDTSWGTYSPEIVDVNLVESDDKVSGQLMQSIDDGRLFSEMYFEASADGEMIAQLTLTPVSGDFTTNRAGLTILHPISDLAGAPVRLTHPDGSEEQLSFPQDISPSQPLMDIAGLAYDVGSVEVDIAFEGEVFEMEDQRNWSDASFKTYCVPLKHPFTYALDHAITQTIRIKMKGKPKRTSANAASGAVSIERTARATPAIGIALEEGWEAEPCALEAVRKCGASHILVRYASHSSDAYLAYVSALATDLGAAIDIENILDADELDETALQAVAAKLEAKGIDPSHVIAIPRAYLSSHQPSGPWPSGPTPNDILPMVRAAFPKAAIGGGMLTNFTEMNRCRPDPKICDYVTHGSTAIVHASDDISVIETLEALPQIFRSAERIGDGSAYRLGLVSIAMRSNPYGESIAENPAQIRETMAREDPRHRGLFGAAWAVGALAATAQSGVKALCLSAPVGPFGMAYQRQPYTQSGYDDGLGAVYPIFHVIRFAAGLKDQDRLLLSGLGEGLVGYGADCRNEDHLMIANLSSRSRSVEFEHAGQFRILDANSFDEAVSDADWLQRSEAEKGHKIDLKPFAIAFVTTNK
ncbi:hypothetical protein [Cohaesibacter sp. ES.047]|uniref:hypothetical protein n=1 Tax=Cohaesibacter sp. ES.047 TaxID=1798205 RepID=UPI0012FDC9C6|nr:hypothetical protein [Cohaesibacter sp. ES.047]